MKSISIIGLGYVGSVSMACFADHGYQVIGVDNNPKKVERINRGLSPVIEPLLPDLIRKGVESGRIQATTDIEDAIKNTDISLVCVGTPSRPNGGLDLSYIVRVSREIGHALASKDSRHIIVARSTMLPGSTEEIVITNIEETSGKKQQVDFDVFYNPEFLREGSSVKDFYDPPFTIIGLDNAKTIEPVESLYSMIDAPFITVPIKVAEMIKYTCNAFHALKVTFANEIGNICKQQEIDSHLVMDIFCQDKKLNISPKYLMPGFAFGGSCLPKDMRALLHHSRHYDVITPVLDSILPSNQRQIDIAFQMVKRTEKKKIGVLGLSFKANTDDLRESPMVELVERLIGKGYQVKIYDKNVSYSNLQGANRDYIEQEIPHIGTILCETIEEVIEDSNVIIIGYKDDEFLRAVKFTRPDDTIIDLVRLSTEAPQIAGDYQGLNW